MVSKFSVENLAENSNSKEIQKSKSNINLEKMINSNENNIKGKFAPNNYQVNKKSLEILIICLLLFVRFTVV